MSKIWRILEKFGGLLLLLNITLWVLRRLGLDIMEFIENSFIPVLISESIWADLLITGKRFALGYLFALCFSIPVGMILGKSKVMDSIFTPVIEALRPIPSSVIIPIALLFLGIGDTMKIFVVWYGAMWPLLIYTMHGARDIDFYLLDTGKVFSLNKFQIFRTIILPSACPQILAGARVSLSIAILLTVTVEMIAGGDPTGLGYRIIDAERSFRYGEMLAGIILLAIFGIILNLLFKKIEQKIKGKRFEYMKIE